jgi:hypothetical protein
MPPRRRLPEVEPAIEALLDDLVARGLAERKRRPWLIYVHDWHQLSADEQHQVTAARVAARAHRAERRVVEERRRVRRLEHQRQLAADRRDCRRAGERRSKWIARGAGRRPRQLDPVTSAAWQEAHARCGGLNPDVHGVWVGLASGLVTWPVLAPRMDFAFVLALLVAIGVGVAMGATELLIMRRVVARLVVQYEAARRLSRRIPAQLRAAVLLRDSACCVHCRSSELLHIDHVIPYSKGGPTSLGHLQVLCAACNWRKGAMSDAEARQRLGNQA